MQEEVTHREIYERLLKVETEIAHIKDNTQGMVEAFNAASGAFVALEWLAKVAKPIILVVGAIGFTFMWLKGIK